MWPRVRRISEERRTASEKSEVSEVSAARNKFPKLWPSSPEPFSKRWRNSLESRASSSLRATMQLRMSPGGSMFSSLRRRPLEPPSSLTVTTADRSRIARASGFRRISAGERTKRFSPLSRVERPVPPPMATTRTPRSSAAFSGERDSAVLVSIEDVPAGQLHRLFFAQLAFHGAEFGVGVGIEQFRKARILSQVLEIRVVPRLETQLSVQTQGLVQTP